MRLQGFLAPSYVGGILDGQQVVVCFVCALLLQLLFFKGVLTHAFEVV